MNIIQASKLQPGRAFSACRRQGCNVEIVKPEYPMFGSLVVSTFAFRYFALRAQASTRLHMHVSKRSRKPMTKASNPAGIKSSRSGIP